MICLKVTKLNYQFTSDPKFLKNFNFIKVYQTSFKYLIQNTTYAHKWLNYKDALYPKDLGPFSFFSSSEERSAYL